MNKLTYLKPFYTHKMTPYLLVLLLLTGCSSRQTNTQAEPSGTPQASDPDKRAITNALSDMKQLRVGMSRAKCEELLKPVNIFVGFDAISHAPSDFYWLTPNIGAWLGFKRVDSNTVNSADILESIPGAIRVREGTNASAPSRWRLISLSDQPSH